MKIAYNSDHVKTKT